MAWCNVKVFNLLRTSDVSGISGTGVVAHVVQFDTGKCVVAWDAPGRPHSVAVYDSLEEINEVHLHGGLSTLVQVWDSGVRQ